MLVATSLLGCGLLMSSNSLKSPHTSMHTFTDKRVQTNSADILVDEFLPIDVTQALEEGQRAKSVGVSDLHIARHFLNQSHEALQLRCDVIWGQGMSTDTEQRMRDTLK